MISFGDVLNECTLLLQSHSSETIIMRIKQENSAVSNEEFVKIIIHGYHDSMYINLSIPNIDSVRGLVWLCCLMGMLCVIGEMYNRCYYRYC